MALPNVRGWRRPTVPMIQCKGTLAGPCIVFILATKPSGRCYGCERDVARYPSLEGNR